MKTMFRLLTGACVASLLTASAAMAHHSFAMFDKSVEKVATAPSLAGQFNAPAFVAVSECQEAGRQPRRLWSFEGSAPQSLLTRGITGSTFEPGAIVTVSYCPMKDGRPAGGLGWARLANGTFVNPADGGCDGSVKAIEKWKAWLAAGYTSSADAQKSK
jgi:hypothetical protein